jgi:hypothetical protein
MVRRVNQLQCGLHEAILNSEAAKSFGKSKAFGGDGYYDPMSDSDAKNCRTVLLSRSDVGICFAIFVFVWLSHASSRTWTSSDSRWTIPTALNIIDRGSANLDNYASMVEQNNFYAIDCVIGETTIRPLKSLAQCAGGHLYNFYPIGVAVLAVPEVYLIRKLTLVADGIPWVRRLIKNSYRRRLLEGDLVFTHPLVEALIASFWIAGATIFIYLIARHFLTPLRSATVALLFAFGTPAWSTASRALWQHGASILLISIAFLALLKAERHAAWLALAGLTLAFAMVVRPTNLIVFVAVCLYLITIQNRRLWIFIAAAIPVFALFVAWAWSVYGVPIAPYYWPHRPGSNSLALHRSFFEALIGNLISPGRGLFVYVPVYLLSIFSMFQRPSDSAFARLRPFVIGILVTHWILISTFEDWWAGWAFGPRYFSDVTPLFVFLLIPMFRQGRFKQLRTVLFVLSLASVAIQYGGANRQADYDWNRTPVSVDQNPKRVWDWSDIAFFR